MSSTKAVRELLRQLPGWKAEPASKHLRLVHQTTGAVVIAAKTPSDYRTIKNTLADCKRAERSQK